MKKKYRIGFPLSIANGGPSNFLKNLRFSFTENKLIKTTFFINPLSDCNIYSNKIRNPWLKPFIYRVDGVGMDTSKSTDELNLINKELKNGIKNSLGVVFQSKFSKLLSENILKIKPNKYSIILNGTDLKKFTKNGSNMRSRLGISEDALVFISSAKWRPRKRLQDMIDIFLKFKEQTSKDVYFIVIGMQNNFIDKKNNIIYIPLIANKYLPNYLRSADIYFFLGWLDPCPNSVVEAIACGLPVICSNSGGTPEIIESTNSGIVVEIDENYNFDLVDLQSPPKINHEKVLIAIHLMVNNLFKYKSDINTEKIDIDYVSSQYCKFILKSLDS